MQKKLLIAMLLVAPLQANAIPIASSVGDFDVTTVTGSFDDLSGTLMSQVWWDDQVLAIEFAGLVQDSFGLPNGSSLGPFFAYELVSFPTVTVVRVGLWCAPPECALGPFATWGNVGESNTVTFAVARPLSVPEPATLSLLGLALLGLALVRRRATA